jgi:hypothetical protein
MLCCFSQFICNGSLLRLSNCLQILESKSILSPAVGLTVDVPFMPMEINATTCIAASQANAAEVDLLAWALPGETVE